jgi:hypothetical protein
MVGCERNHYGSQTLFYLLLSKEIILCCAGARDSEAIGGPGVLLEWVSSAF